MKKGLFEWIFPNNLHFIHVLLQKQGQTHEISARCLQISHEIFPMVQNGIDFAPNFAKNSRNTGPGQPLTPETIETNWSQEVHRG